MKLSKNAQQYINGLGEEIANEVFKLYVDAWVKSYTQQDLNEFVADNWDHNSGEDIMDEVVKDLTSSIRERLLKKAKLRC